MEQAQVDEISKTIAELRLKLIRVVGQHSLEFGFDGAESKALVEHMQLEFFKAWFAGVPADTALIRAVRHADQLICKAVMQKAVDTGDSTEAAFERIKAMKIRSAGGSTEAQAMADAASAAFKTALGNGASETNALEAAFTTAAR